MKIIFLNIRTKMLSKACDIGVSFGGDVTTELDDAYGYHWSTAMQKAYSLKVGPGEL